MPNLVISLLPASPYHKRFAMDNGKEGLQKWDGKKPVVCTVGIHKNFFRKKRNLIVEERMEKQSHF